MQAIRETEHIHFVNATNSNRQRSWLDEAMEKIAILAAAL